MIDLLVWFCSNVLLITIYMHISLPKVIIFCSLNVKKMLLLKWYFYSKFFHLIFDQITVPILNLLSFWFASIHQSFLVLIVTLKDLVWSFSCRLVMIDFEILMPVGQLRVFLAFHSHYSQKFFHLYCIRFSSLTKSEFLTFKIPFQKLMLFEFILILVLE